MVLALILFSHQNVKNEQPRQQILLIPLPAWMQMGFFCLFMCVFVCFHLFWWKKSWVYRGTSRKMRWIELQVWVGGTEQPRLMSLSQQDTHTHTHFSSITDTEGKKGVLLLPCCCPAAAVFPLHVTKNDLRPNHYRSCVIIITASLFSYFFFLF